MEKEAKVEKTEIVELLGARALVRFVPVRPFVLGQKAILTCTRPRFTL